jgi:hypothetical protein
MTLENAKKMYDHFMAVAEGRELVQGPKGLKEASGKVKAECLANAANIKVNIDRKEAKAKREKQRQKPTKPEEEKEDGEKPEG